MSEMPKKLHMRNTGTGGIAFSREPGAPKIGEISETVNSAYFVVAPEMIRRYNCHEQLVGAIRRNEWGGQLVTNAFQFRACPDCYGVDPGEDNLDALLPHQIGHTEQCKLQAAIDAAEGE